MSVLEFAALLVVMVSVVSLAVAVRSSQEVRVERPLLVCPVVSSDHKQHPRQMARQRHDTGTQKRAYDQPARRRRRAPRKKTGASWCRLRGHSLSCSCVYG